MPDMLPSTFVALFVATCCTCVWGTIGNGVPLYLSTEKGWSTAEYGTFFIFWGLAGFLGQCVAGWLADRVGRRAAFVVMLIQGAIFLTAWLYTTSHLWVWIFGL